MIIAVIAFFGTNSAVAQSKKCKDCIEWSAARKLSWSDFRGTPKNASRNEALTDSGMSIDLQCDNSSSTVTIQCYFNRQRSWTKDKESKYLLAHEQLHFDITELFVRKLRKQIAALGNDCQKLNQHIEEYYNKNYRAFVRYQHAYDSESKHSLNKEMQAYWEKKVARELKELEEFASRPNS